MASLRLPTGQRPSPLPSPTAPEALSLIPTPCFFVEAQAVLPHGHPAGVSRPEQSGGQPWISTAHDAERLETRPPVFIYMAMALCQQAGTVPLTFTSWPGE